jgi:hypothetical protein
LFPNESGNKFDNGIVSIKGRSISGGGSEQQYQREEEA